MQFTLSLDKNRKYGNAKLPVGEYDALWWWDGKHGVVTIYLPQLLDIAGEVDISDNVEAFTEAIAIYSFIEFFCLDQFMSECTPKLTFTKFREKYFCQKLYEDLDFFCVFQELSFYIFNHVCEELEFDDKSNEFIEKVKQIREDRTSNRLK